MDDSGELQGEFLVTLNPREPYVAVIHFGMLVGALKFGIQLISNMTDVYR